MAKLTLVTADDWQGLYVDGVLVHEDHRIRPGDLFDLAPLGVLEEREADLAWMEERGRLPTSLDDVRWGADYFHRWGATGDDRFRYDVPKGG